MAPHLMPFWRRVIQPSPQRNFQALAARSWK
jgi:hypothetical protein